VLRKLEAALVAAVALAVAPVPAWTVAGGPAAWHDKVPAGGRASQAGGSPSFGTSVAVSGKTIVVGDTGAARAYIFAEALAGWERTAELGGSVAPFGQVCSGFGRSVAVAGNTVVVGALSGICVYTRTASGWRQAAGLRPIGPGGGLSGNFGASVAVSRTTIVAGAPGAGSSGRAYVFTKAGTGWRQAAVLKGSDTAVGDNFGLSVAVSGGAVVVGAPSHSAQAGRAYVFSQAGAGWHQAVELLGSDTAAGDRFGETVAVSGTTVGVGAPGHAASTGRAYVFARTAGGWHQAAELRGSDTAPGYYFGAHVAVSGSAVVVGDPSYPRGGRAYIFTRAGVASSWGQAAELEGAKAGCHDQCGRFGAYPVFGISVGLSGPTAVVGAMGGLGSVSPSAGHVYVFAPAPKGWRQIVALTGPGTDGMPAAASPR
jgi:hypothetical protein